MAGEPEDFNLSCRRFGSRFLNGDSSAMRSFAAMGRFNRAPQTGEVFLFVPYVHKSNSPAPSAWWAAETDKVTMIWTVRYEKNSNAAHHCSGFTRGKTILAASANTSAVGGQDILRAVKCS
jgi:hypothetical protein